ncbi:hypothetical protein GCM10009555_073850 [Acrocarpospora macrocephala]|uniref:Uncharacterized protein n=1 Tax=Acrocarpospora macrocephala TaxID=150177 RepID=A0A5M3WQ36_9ACTN|nr:hypothetical protein [Acrocarpospora macrocephala]GES11457.1 hypothetical protein Amac_050540 [Acrocarpospora macrocephala]
MANERYYGGDSSAFITALVALQRAQGVPLDQAYQFAESTYRETTSRKGGNSFGNDELLEFLRLFEQR